jgi:hypothetical protein
MISLITNPSASLVFFLLLFHCLIGLGAAIVADLKAHSFLKWLIMGLIGGTFALIFSVVILKSNENY